MRGLRSYLAAALAIGLGYPNQGAKSFFMPFTPKPTKSKPNRVSQKKRRLNARRLNKK
jgi:hypothetical protein